MKPLLTTICLLAISAATFAQRSSVSKNIIVDDLIMTIKVDVEETGRSLHYHRSFKVEGMSQEERQALENHILDSLGINTPVKHKKYKEEPVAMAQGSGVSTWSKPDEVTLESPTTGATMYSQGQRAATTVTGSAQSPSNQATLVGGSKPYTKEVNDDPETGRLFMRYRYTKDGEEYIYERTVNAQGKSDKEKQRIIRETEKEIGLPANQ